MEILTVEYSQLVSHGDFNNTKVGASAFVGEDETAEEALAKLKDWVTAQFDEDLKARGNVRQARGIRYDIERLQGDKTELENKLIEARDAWDKAKAFLEKHGVDVAEIESNEELPF